MTGQIDMAIGAMIIASKLERMGFEYLIMGPVLQPAESKPNRFTTVPAESEALVESI